MRFLWNSCIMLARDQTCANSLRSCSVLCKCISVTKCRATSIVNSPRPRPSRCIWTTPRPNRILWSESRNVCDYSSFSEGCFRVGIGVIPSKLCDHMKRTLSTTSEQNKNQDGTALRVQKHLHNLEVDVQRGNSVTKSEIENILHLMKICESKVYLANGLDAGLLLLQCCGDLMPDQLPAIRVELAHDIVNTMQKIGITMAVQHYNALLRCYIENKHVTSTSVFLKNMTVGPDEQTYHLLLLCACETGDLEKATDVISQMKQKGLPASEPVFNALVYGHTQTGDLASALGVFETMQSAQVLPSSDTYTALVRGLAMGGNVDQIQKTLQEATLNNTALSQNQIFSVLKALSISGNAKSLPLVLPWLPELDVEGGLKMKSLLTHLAHLGIDEAVTLLVRRLPIDDSSPFGRFIIREMVKANRPVKSILSLCELLSEHNPLALTQATEAALHANNKELAVELLQAMKKAEAPVRSHYFWPLLLSEGRSRGEEGVFEILHHMQGLDVPVDSTTLSFYVLPYVSLGSPSVLVRRLQDLGLALSEVLSPVVAAVIDDGRMKASFELCGKFQTQLDCETLLNPLAKALLSGVDVNMVVDLLKVFVKSSRKPADWTGRFLLELIANKRMMIDTRQLGNIIKILSAAGLCCSHYVSDVVSQHISMYPIQSKDTEEILVTLTGMIDPSLLTPPVEAFSHHMVHPRDMTLEELECQLVELQAKGMNTRGVLRRLLQLYCRLGNMEKALEIKEELEKAKHEFTPGMRAALFDLFLQRRQLDHAETSYFELSRDAPNFLLDEHKVIDYATLLLANKQQKMALSVLVNRSKHGPLKGGASLSRNCWRLLHTTAEQGDPETTRKMLHTLVELGYCSISNALLGPLIRAHLFREDLEGAVSEFQNCVTKYKKTPLHYELLCQLINGSDKSSADSMIPPDEATLLMHDVLTSVQKIHGAPNSFVTFVVALAETGKLKQLSRLLRESSAKVNATLLIKRCKRLVDEDKLEALQNLVTAFRGIKSFNLTPFLTFVLQLYCRRGDSQGALHLWTSIQEMDCEPSSEFLIMLADLLESHKIEVPFSVPHSEVELRFLQKPKKNRLDNTL